MDGSAQPGAPPDTAEHWFVHRHTLSPERGTVLTGPATRLAVTPEEAGGFTAIFELARGSDPIPLRKNLIGVESYQGKGNQHYARILHLEDPARGLDLLIGHVTAHDAPTFGVRDLFIACREARATRPCFGDQDFLGPRLPLHDHRRHEPGGVIRLLRTPCGHQLFLEAETDGYDIRFEPLVTGGLEFRHRVDKGHSVGGLMLPLAAAGQPLQLLCFRHRHCEAVHCTVPPGEERPVGDVPGHPACTTVYAGIGP